MPEYLKNKLPYLITLICLLPYKTMAAGVAITDPLGIDAANPVPSLANRLIQTVLGLSGVLALIAFIYGGILYMLAGIDSKNVDKGKAMMKNAVIGLVIIFSSYAIVNFVLQSVLQVK